MLLALVLATVYKLRAEGVIALFSDNPAVISSGAEYISFMAFFYIMAFVDELTQGFFRGLGRLKLTMVFTLAQMLLRVLLSFPLAARLGVVGIGWAVLAGWILQFAVEFSYGIYCALKLKDA